MTLVYITVRFHANPDEVFANYEFSGDDWMQALDKAYAWLKVNRRADASYYVWC